MRNELLELFQSPSHRGSYSDITALQVTDKLDLHKKFQSPSHRGSYSDDYLRGGGSGGRVCFNPLLIGEVIQTWQAPKRRALATGDGFNPLLIGEVIQTLATQNTTTVELSAFQSPSHRGS